MLKFMVSNKKEWQLVWNLAVIIIYTKDHANIPEGCSWDT